MHGPIWPGFARLGLTALLLFGCGDATGSNALAGGARFRYDDGVVPAFTASTDSALFRVGPDSSFLAVAYVPASGSHLTRRFTWTIDSLGGEQLPVGVYTVNLPSPLLGGFDMRTDVEIAVADSGVITVTRSDSAEIAGTVDLHLSYIQFIGSRPAPFHLTGPFVFYRSASGVLP